MGRRVQNILASYTLFKSNGRLSVSRRGGFKKRPIGEWQRGKRFLGERPRENRSAERGILSGRGSIVETDVTVRSRTK